MNKHIVLLNTAHFSFDDRVFYHQAESLSQNGYRVTIVSTMETRIEAKENIHISSCNLNSFSQNGKQQKIIEHLGRLSPDIVICDTPIAVLSAYKYGKKHKIKIVYDITEWYPSYNNLKNCKGLKKGFRRIILILFYLYAGFISDGFIFGEQYKSKPFRLLYFWKPFVFLSYFPDLKYIKPLPIGNITQTIRLFYGGSFSPRRGIRQLVQSTIKAAQNKPEITFQLHLIGNVSTTNEQHYFDELANTIPANVEIHLKPLLFFADFCQYISRMDLYFDLRTMSWEQNHSLPIKLFYYLACGRPVIYSKLKSITNFFSDISFGFLVNPSDCDAVTHIILHYIENQTVYTEHCQNALKLSRKKYNWDTIKDDFLRFIQQF